jgi:hypothetical protein
MPTQPDSLSAIATNDALSVPLLLQAEVGGLVAPLSSNRSSQASQSLLFVDGGVADYQTLIAGVSPGTEVHVLDSSQDAVTQITNTLLGRYNISSLHIISHGEAGGLDFGAGKLNLSDLPRYAAQLQSWNKALTDDADLLLYGCDVAEGELGKAFVNILSQLTGADVAASDNLTGSARQGGDWTLEFNTGDIEATLAFDAKTRQAYDFTLQVNYLYNSTTGDLNFTANEASLAQNLSINFNGSTYTFSLAGGELFQRSSDPGNVVTGNNTSTVTFGAGIVNRIFMSLRGGSDTITFQTSGPSGYLNSFNIDGDGAGESDNDVINFNVSGGAVFQRSLLINSVETFNVNQSLDVTRGSNPANEADQYDFAANAFKASFNSIPGPLTLNLAQNATIITRNGGFELSGGTTISTQLTGAAGTNAISTSGIGRRYNFDPGTGGPEIDSGTGNPRIYTDEPDIILSGQTSATGNANLTLSSDGNISWTAIAINGALSTRVDSDDDETRSFTAANFQASSFTFRAGGTSDTLRLSSSLAAAGGMTIAQWSDVQLVSTQAAISGGLNLPSTIPLTVNTLTTTGQYTINGLSLGSALNVNLRGTAPGGGSTGYDQLVVAGSVSLNNAALNLAVTSPFVPTIGSSFTIIDNDSTDPVNGIFNGLAEGATVTVGATNFRISYVGGTGNDVVLTVPVLDAIAPTANLSPIADVTTTGANLTFTVTYSDNTAINVADLNNLDVRVTGPSSFDQLATLVSVNVNTNGTPRVATYQITAPGGIWDGADNGTYTVSMEANQVRDTANNPVASGTLGSFNVNAPATVSLTASMPNATENVTPGVYTISRTGSTTNLLTVKLTIAGSSTASTADYTLSEGGVSVSGNDVTVTLAANASSVQVNLNAIAEALGFAEAAETLTLNLASDPTYTISSSNNTGTVTIAQNGFIVTSTNDTGEGSLRQAVLNANAIAGTDTITFAGSTFTDATPDTITLTSGELGMSSNLTLQGTGANLLTISGNNVSRVFNIGTGANVTLSALTINRGNAGGGFGGGIYNNGTLTVSNSTLSSNTASNGGGIWNEGSTLTLNSSTLSGNSAPGGTGGGITINGGTVSLNNSTLSGNTSGNFGGGIDNNGNLTVNNSTFSGNTATNNGGALWNFNTLALSNSTFSGNTAANGGGLYNNSNGTITSLSNSTFSGNTTGIYSSGAIATLVNNTIAGSTNAGISNIGTITNLYNNLLVGNGNNTLPTATNASNNLTGTFAVLNVDSTLRSNGGTTQTYALLPGSAAINGGTSTSAPTTDQRGISRVGAVDIGAFESRGFTIAATGGNNQSTLTNTAFTNPLAVTVSSAFSEPVAGGKVTYVANGTGANASLSGSPTTINASGNASTTATANGTAGSYTVSAGGNGIATPASFSLTNIPPNALPTSANTSATFNEDTVYTFTTADFPFTDGDSGDTLQAIQITQLPVAGSLTLNGNAVNANATISLSNITSGNLKFTPFANAFGTNYASLQFKVSDGAGFSTAAYTLALNVTAVNDAPILSVLSNSLNLDGINDYARTTAPITHNQNFTYEAWVKFPTNNPAWSGIMTTSTLAGSGGFVQFSNNGSGRLRAEISGSSTFNVDGTISMSDGNWHHVALTYDGASLKTYVDGALDINSNVNQTFTVNRQVFIGQNGS